MSQHGTCQIIHAGSSMRTQETFQKFFNVRMVSSSVAVRTVLPNQVRLIGSTGLDSGLVLAERSVKEWVGVLRDSGGGLLGTVLRTRQGLY